MDFLSAAHNGDVARLQQLVASRPELVNIQDSNGFTGLALAAEKGYAKACEVLLRANSLVDARTTTGNTPIMWAAARGHTAAAQVLLSHSADITLANENGDSALMWGAAAGHVDILQLMLRHSARQADARSREKPLPDPLQQVTKKGMNAVMFAAAAGQSAALQLFLSMLPRTVDEPEVCSTQLATADREGNLPLHHAALNGRLDTVQLLLQLDVDARSSWARNKKGDTALELATQAGHSEVADLLEAERVRLEASREKVADALLAELTGDASAGTGEAQKGKKKSKGKNKKNNKKKKANAARPTGHEQAATAKLSDSDDDDRPPSPDDESRPVAPAGAANPASDSPGVDASAAAVDDIDDASMALAIALAAQDDRLLRSTATVAGQSAPGGSASDGFVVPAGDGSATDVDSATTGAVVIDVASEWTAVTGSSREAKRKAKAKAKQQKEKEQKQHLERKAMLAREQQQAQQAVAREQPQAQQAAEQPDGAATQATQPAQEPEKKQHRADHQSPQQQQVTLTSSDEGDEWQPAGKADRKKWRLKQQQRDKHTVEKKQQSTSEALAASADAIPAGKEKEQTSATASMSQAAAVATAPTSPATLTSGDVAESADLMALYIAEKARADQLQNELTATENSWGRWQEELLETKLIDLSTMDALDLVRVATSICRPCSPCVGKRVSYAGTVLCTCVDTFHCC